MDLFGLAGVDFGPAWDAVSIGGRDDEAPSALGWLLLDFRVDLADKQFGPIYLKQPGGDTANQHGFRSIGLTLAIINTRVGKKHPSLYRKGNNL